MANQITWMIQPDHDEGVLCFIYNHYSQNSYQEEETPRLAQTNRDESAGPVGGHIEDHHPSDAI